MNRRFSAFVKTALILAIPFAIVNVLSILNMPEFIISIATLLGVPLFVILLLLSIYLILAPENLFFTFVPENKVKFIVSGGKLKKILLSSNQYELNEKYDVVDGKSSGLWGGLFFYGFWPLSDVLIYRFSWVNITKTSEVVPHEKVLDTMILKVDMYLTELKGAEDIDMIPVNVKAILTARIVNPYKAMYAAQDWLENLINIVNPAIRNEISKNSFLELVKGESDPKNNLEKYSTLGKNIFNELEKSDLGELEKTYGVCLSAVRVENIDPKSEELRGLTLKKVIADKTAEATIVEAKGIAEATIIKAKGEADAFSKKAAAWRNEGVEPKIGITVEGLDKSSLNYTLLGGGAFDFLKDELKKK